MNRRLDRVARELREIISGYIIRNYNIEEYGLVTINRVQTARDLRSAEVFLTVFGSKDVETTTIKTLNENRSEIQSEIARSLPMRYCPKLKFLKDDRTPQLLALEKELYANSRPI